MTFSEFLAMGGYAPFVWPAFGVAAALLVLLLVVSRRRLKAREAEFEALEKAQRTRSRGGGSP